MARSQFRLRQCLEQMQYVTLFRYRSVPNFFYRLQTYVGVHAAKHAKIVLCFIASINVLEENQLSLHHPQNVCYQVFNFNSTED